MLDPRVYRTGLIVAALALVVLAFSLENPQGALSPSLAPTAFNAANVAATMRTIAAQEPARPPGSPGDGRLAASVATALRADGFSISQDTYAGQTVDGQRTLANVVGTLPGVENGSIVVVAPRDATGAPGQASASATATLLELGRVLGGETLNRTIVLASISGTQGDAGAVRLAGRLPGPIDAVIVLGDLAGARPRQPLVIPWAAGSPVIAPSVLQTTLAAQIAAQTSLRASAPSFAGQLAHLAAPLALGAQGPFADDGVPAVTLSVSGELGPASDAPLGDATQAAGLGRAVLETISALDGAATIPRPSRYLIFDQKIVPGWGISLFVLTLILTVLLTLVDGIARARRHGHPVAPSLLLVLASAAPFVLAVLVVLLARLVGAIGIAPPGAVAPGAVALHGGGIAVLVVAGLALLGGVGAVAATALRWGHTAAGDGVDAEPALSPAPLRDRGRRSRPARAGQTGPRVCREGASVALAVVMCLVTLAVWLTDPLAALLLIPALHLWLWSTGTDLRAAAVVRLALVLAGLAPIAWVVAYHAHALGFDAVGVAWGSALLVAGHAVGTVAALEWSIVLGCGLSAVAIVVLVPAAVAPPTPAEITVRGPIGYAGPGSLGGTKSALRR